MKKYSITSKDGQLLQVAFFKDDKVMKEFTETLRRGEAWGKAERWKDEKECSKEELELSLRTEKRERGLFHLLPSEYEITIEDYEIPKEVLLKEDIQKEIDPCDFMCAMMDKELGDSTAYKLLLEKYQECKKKMGEK